MRSARRARYMTMPSMDGGGREEGDESRSRDSWDGPRSPHTGMSIEHFGAGGQAPRAAGATMLAPGRHSLIPRARFQIAARGRAVRATDSLARSAGSRCLRVCAHLREGWRRPNRRGLAWRSQAFGRRAGCPIGQRGASGAWIGPGIGSQSAREQESGSQRAPQTSDQNL